MWNTFTFGDVYSEDFDVYITGRQAFNAPSRVYEMIDIPGRSGQLAIDGKRYENIEVSYPAGLFDLGHEGYREKIAAIRNALASQTGYQRLTDSYNPDEFRMAIYAGPFDTEPVSHLRASEFEINFNCKPQRFLTSGELPEAYPQGGGNVLPEYSDSTVTRNGITFTVNDDGTITANGTATADADFGVRRQNVPPHFYIDEETYRLTGCPTGGSTSTYYMFINHTGSGGAVIYGNDTGSGLEFEGVANERVGVWIRICAGTTVNNLTFYPKLQVVGSGTSGTITNPTRYEAKPLLAVTGVGTLNIGEYSMTLTGSASQTVYIDCEIMEAWTLSGGTKINANDRVRYAGNEFPALGPGENALSWDSTITSLLITPRWWRL